MDSTLSDEEISLLKELKGAGSAVGSYLKHSRRSHVF